MCLFQNTFYVPPMGTLCKRYATTMLLYDVLYFSNTFYEILITPAASK